MGNSPSRSSAKTAAPQGSSRGPRLSPPRLIELDDDDDMDAPPPYSASDPALSEMDLHRLSLYDTVFLVDDSGSMRAKNNLGRSRWKQACDCLVTYAEIAARFDTDGVDVYFLNNKDIEKKNANLNMSAGKNIRSLFKNISPQGYTPTGQRLRNLLESYLDEVSSSKKTNKLPRPRNYVIITDGAATDRDILVHFLKETADLLDSLNCPPTQLGFQFVQIGDDTTATAFLDRLDGDLSYSKRDIVDTVKSGPDSALEDDALIKKILLGGINRYYDLQARS